MLLELKSVTLKRNKRILFKNFSLKLNQSQIIVIKGKNGIGKSSLLEFMVGLAKQNSGLKYSNFELVKTNPITKSKVFYLGHQNSLKDNLTILENLKIWNNIFGLQLTNETITDSLKYFDLKKYSESLVGKLSMGQKRKVALTKLLFLKKITWFLDEPTNGLDSFSEKKFFWLLKKHQEDGGSVIMTTHSNIKIPNCLILNLKPFINHNSTEFDSWDEL
tara:strand:+ start:2597 stop:3253 length:657 start_codon:yes stop_codon:yes gene_type:complete